MSLAVAAYLWLIGGQLLAVLVALGFGLTEALHYLRFDPLLAFMVAGFVVANFSEQGEKLLSAIEETGSVVYVVFFATAGAHIDLGLVRRLWPVALFLVGVRIAAIFVAHFTRFGRNWQVIVQADPMLPLFEAHILSGKVKGAILSAVPNVAGVLIHMEPFDSDPG